MYYITRRTLTTDPITKYSCYFVSDDGQTGNIMEHNIEPTLKYRSKCNFNSLHELLSLPLRPRLDGTIYDLEKQQEYIFPNVIHSQPTLPTLNLLNTHPELFI